MAVFFHLLRPLSLSVRGTFLNVQKAPGPWGLRPFLKVQQMRKGAVTSFARKISIFYSAGGQAYRRRFPPP